MLHGLVTVLPLAFFEKRNIKKIKNDVVLSLFEKLTAVIVGEAY